MLSDRDIRDPAAQALARRLGPKGGDEEGTKDAVQMRKRQARRIYRWVLEHVEDTQEVFGLAPAMLAERTGNRARVLHYLLTLADIPSELVLARDASADQTPSKLADDRTYNHLLVAVTPGSDRTFLSTAQQGAPYGYLPPLLRGQDGIVLGPDAERVRLPETREGQDRRTVEANVQLTEEGAAQVDVVEQFVGAGAVTWRDQLGDIPRATLEQRFGQQYVARLLPGAQLERLRIEGDKDPERPFTLRYTFRVPVMGRPQGNQLVVPGLFPSNLAAIYARTPDRQTPELVAPPVDAVIRVTLRLPETARVADRPEERTLRGPGGARFSLSVDEVPGGLRLERELRLPMQRVHPDEYEAFAELCRAVDRAEAQETIVR
jgi:hypothetical protein